MTRAEVEEALREVVDPELGINVVDLGLVYRLEIRGEEVSVDLATTSPSCPLGEHLKNEAAAAIRRRLPRAAAISVAIVNDPPWTPERMSAAARILLGWP